MRNKSCISIRGNILAYVEQKVRVYESETPMWVGGILPPCEKPLEAPPRNSMLISLIVALLYFLLSQVEM